MTPMPAFTRLAAAAALVLLSAPVATHAQTQAAAPAASAASAPAYAVRPALAASLNQAVDQFRGGKVAEAKALVDRTLATTTTPQPAETTVIQRLRGLLALQLGQTDEAVKALEAALAVNEQSPQDQLSSEEALARAHFNLKAYPAAAEWARKAQSHGSKAANIQAVLVRATYLQNDYAGTIKLLEAQQQAGTLPMDDLRILASSYGQLKQDDKYITLIEQLLTEHGRTEYWPDLLSRAPGRPGWQERFDIDLYRLRMQLDMMDEADDYLLLADLTARAGLPAEAQQVLDAGFAKGVLGKGPKAADQQKLRATVTKQAADDRPSLVAAAGRAPAVGDARAAAGTFNTGAALVSAGQHETGLALMKAALAGPVADPDQARLQYGQALARAGKAAEAAEQFKQVGSQQGPLALLGRLWGAAVTPKKAS
ncbi:tetratricopeptide repeat protein [Pseudorhodoferax sp.]|uniref:tetratricopeptide repeat protein n=1 Tax=Pseudorhodoferax sp. TaxID=1993553 RepID=UPI002DD65261|nr:tetratricopeptide repeat protein [Pseudorhodoferax sp.]